MKTSKTRHSNELEWRVPLTIQLALVLMWGALAAFHIFYPNAVAWWGYPLPFSAQLLSSQSHPCELRILGLLWSMSALQDQVLGLWSAIRRLTIDRPSKITGQEPSAAAQRLPTKRS